VVDTRQALAAVRQEIDGLKALLQMSGDTATRRLLLARLNECICENIRLVDQQLQPYVGVRVTDEPVVAPEPLR
jgi:hypothetical protein